MPGLLDFIYDSPIFVDLYGILEVDMDSKSDEIKMAWIKLAKKNHPDQGGSSEKFEEITRAYEILYNKESRKEYDLYYLKKSMDEFKTDEIMRMRDEFKNFINANSKPITKEELDKLYDETFKESKEKFKKEVIDQEEFSNRLNDIEIERNNMQIELSDDTLENFLKEHVQDIDGKKINISDVFEYLKYKNSDTFGTSIVEKEWGTLDTLPGYANGYSFINEDEYFGSNMYSNISDMNTVLGKDSVNNLSIEEFVAWKNTRHLDTKLTESEMDLYLKKRELEQLDLFKQVESDLSDRSKKKEVEKFLKTKHITESVDKYYEELDKPGYDDKKIKHKNKSSTTKSSISKSNVPEIIDLENPDNPVTKTSSEFETSTDLDGMLKYMENIKSEKSENLEELEKELVIDNPKYSENVDKGSFQDLKTGRELPKINNVRKREFK